VAERTQATFQPGQRVYVEATISHTSDDGLIVAQVKGNASPRGSILSTRPCYVHDADTLDASRVQYDAVWGEQVAPLRDTVREQQREIERLRGAAKSALAMLPNSYEASQVLAEALKS
jgi:hypothetical protein